MKSSVLWSLQDPGPHCMVLERMPIQTAARLVLAKMLDMRLSWSFFAATLLWKNAQEINPSHEGQSGSRAWISERDSQALPRGSL